MLSPLNFSNMVHMSRALLLPRVARLRCVFRWTKAYPLKEAEESSKEERRIFRSVLDYNPCRSNH